MAVTTRAPSGENAALRTELSWPRRTAISAPMAAPQTRAVRSLEAVTELCFRSVAFGVGPGALLLGPVQLFLSDQLLSFQLLS